MKKFAVAVDGPAGSGKSTVAKEIAKALGILYIDTGAMYRTVGMAYFPYPYRRNRQGGIQCSGISESP